MTNYERLLDLPLREVLKEFDCEDLSLECAAEMFSFIIVCPESHEHSDVKACKLCGDVSGSCSRVCFTWLDSESTPDANYNEDVWHDAANEDPPTSDVTIEYIVVVDGAELPTTLIFDGDSWRDHSGAYYRVALWRPMPKLPEEYNA